MAAVAVVAGIVAAFRLVLSTNPTTVALALLVAVLVVSATWGLRLAVFLAVLIAALIALAISAFMPRARVEDVEHDSADPMSDAA